MSGPRLRDLTVKQYGHLLGPYIGLSIVGFLLGFYPTGYPWHETVLRIGDALLIAGILASGVELWSSNRLMQRVADELAGKLVGRGLPAQLQKQIGDLTKVGLVRNDFKKVYRFEDPKNGKITICITTEVSG